MGSNPTPSTKFVVKNTGDIAQLGEQLPCTQPVAGSMPVISTMNYKVTTKKSVSTISGVRIDFAT